MGLINLNIVERWKSASRAYYIPPAARGVKPFTPEGTDLTIWLYEVESTKGTKYCAIVFIAKQSKPLFHNVYSSKSSRDHHIKDIIKERKSFVGTL